MRRIARTVGRSEANSILCGAMKQKGLYPADDGYVAEVEAGFYLIGLDNNYVNAHINYFSAVGRTKSEALAKAKRQAAAESVQYLTRAALRTMQLENRGGRHHIMTELQFYGIYDQINQRQKLLEVLQQMNCRIIREAFTPDGTYKLRVNAAGYDTPGELSMMLTQRILQEGINIRPIETVDSQGPKLVFTVTGA